MVATFGRPSLRPSPVDLSPDSETDPRLGDAFRRAASMEEVAALRDPAEQTPEGAIRALKEGNARFFAGRAVRSEFGAFERRAQIVGQTPFAVVVGCSDSRVPVEIVFDQGPGHLFVVRVAGQVASEGVVGSLEFAVRHLKCHLVVVLGHEGCGAVQAAMQPAAAVAAEPEHLRRVLAYITPAVEGMPPIRDKKARLREAVLHNVRLQVERLRRNPVIGEAEASGAVRVIGAFYEIGSGAVDFLVEEDELAR